MSEIALRTLLVSGMATALAVLVGVPLGYAIARRSFRGRTILLGLINTGMGMPPGLPIASLVAKDDESVSPERCVFERRWCCWTSRSKDSMNARTSD